MNSLESNLREILSQKETKIIPENIKKGINIFRYRRSVRFK